MERDKPKPKSTHHDASLQGQRQSGCVQQVVEATHTLKSVLWSLSSSSVGVQEGVKEAQKTLSGTKDAHENYLCISPTRTRWYQNTVQSDLVQAELILTSAIVVQVILH